MVERSNFMDFTNRSAQPQSFQPGQTSSSAASEPEHNEPKKSRKADKLETPQWYRWVSMALLVVVVLLVLSLVGLIATSKPANQGKYVDSSNLQAVFLNSGQVYFGHVTSLNNNFFVLSNIYYLQSSNTNTNTTQQSTDSNISLVKLGCELHRPYDQMVINSDQVTFWENLNKDGQVAQAVKQFQDKNPDGQTCSNTAPATTDNVQGSNADNTSNDTTKKP
jgi:hypothetical protein